MMPFGKVMEKEYCGIGSFCWLSLSQRTIAIMLKKESTCYSSIIANFQKGRELSFCGAVVSTQGAILEPTFHVICLWNI